jgi:hypothetical protein
MATSREYAYFIKGNKVAIVERDRNDTSGLTSPSSVPSIDLPNQFSKWKSPQATVADALEIEYVYSPKYSIINTNVTHITLTNYKSTTTGGYLKVKGGSVNYDTTLDVGDYVVLRNAGQFNGLHKITVIEDAAATKDSLTFDTKYSGSSSWSAFEETVTLYYSISVLEDESGTIDLPTYLSKALVCYVRAQLAEDIMEMELAAYWMVRFRKILEKHENSKIPGPRRVIPGSGAIL